jgi:hypothetical protein
LGWCVVPLALAVGASAEMRSTLGIAVFSGMLGVTLFGIFLTPVFYYLVVKLFGTGTPPITLDVVHAQLRPANGDGTAKQPALATTGH